MLQESTSGANKTTSEIPVKGGSCTRFGKSSHSRQETLCEGKCAFAVRCCRRPCPNAECRHWDGYTDSHDQNIKQTLPKRSLFDVECFLRVAAIRSSATRTEVPDCSGDKLIAEDASDAAQSTAESASPFLDLQLSLKPLVCSGSMYTRCADRASRCRGRHQRVSEGQTKRHCFVCLPGSRATFLFSWLASDQGFGFAFQVHLGVSRRSAARRVLFHDLKTDSSEAVALPSPDKSTEKSGDDIAVVLL